MKRNQQGGFIQLIIMIVVVLFIMKYMGLTFSGVWNWFISSFGVVLQ